MRTVSIPFVFASFLGCAFAGLHHHHAHGHVHRHLIPHAEKVEPRDLTWDHTHNVPDDFVVEFVTHTTTTTVFGKCAPTNTLHSTLTLVKSTPDRAPYVPSDPAHNISIPGPSQPHLREPEPQPTIPAPKPTELEEITTIFGTRTVTKTATNTVKVTVHPGSDHTPVAETAPGTPAAGNTIPLADTLPKGSAEQEKAVPTGNASSYPPPQKDNGGPIDTVLDLPGQVLPDIPVIDQVVPGSKADQSAPKDWTATVPEGQFSTKRFGGRTPPQGREIHYRGNTGMPWGSNIILVSPAEAHQYKYVAQFKGSNKEPWTVVVWNKFGPDGKLTGWYGHSAVTFSLPPGETRYVAFDEDSEGAWGAAPGDHLPTDHWGGYSCTWGEFSFGDGENKGWSGWDVSAIQAQVANQHVQGMSICQANGKGCSIITPNAEKVVDAYVKSKKHIDGIGGAVGPGPVRLKVLLDYRE